MFTSVLLATLDPVAAHADALSMGLVVLFFLGLIGGAILGKRR